MPEYDSSSEHKSQIESNNQANSSDDEDTFPYPILLDLIVIFAELDDFVPHVSVMDGDSDSSNDITDSHHTPPEQVESSHALHIEYLYKNPSDEVEFFPITICRFFILSLCSTNSREYEFDSLS